MGAANRKAGGPSVSLTEGATPERGFKICLAFRFSTMRRTRNRAWFSSGHDGWGFRGVAEVRGRGWGLRWNFCFPSKGEKKGEGREAKQERRHTFGQMVRHPGRATVQLSPAQLLCSDDLTRGRLDLRVGNVVSALFLQR